MVGSRLSCIRDLSPTHDRSQGIDVDVMVYGPLNDEMCFGVSRKIGEEREKSRSPDEQDHFHSKVSPLQRIILNDDHFRRIGVEQS
jgi:hypothetical protein